MNFNPLVPELTVSDFEKSLSFYTEVLKFRIEFQRPEHHFAFLSHEGCQLMIGQGNAEWETGKLLLGRREFLVMDPDGYLLRFAQSSGERPL